METEHDIPLRWRTPPGWALRALADPLALLDDHAHLEKKAAANALELVHRYPDAAHADGDGAFAAYVDRWTKTLSVIAREESEHLALVVRLLQRRGGRLSRQHRNAYAAELRRGVRMGRGPLELLDRLMVSALIELRSCERFGVLSVAAAGPDPELASLYRGLYASEMGHYLVFIELARGLSGAGDVDAAWSHWLDLEARVIRAQPPGSWVHSGPEAP